MLKQTLSSIPNCCNWYKRQRRRCSRRCAVRPLLVVTVHVSTSTFLEKQISPFFRQNVPIHPLHFSPSASGCWCSQTSGVLYQAGQTKGHQQKWLIVPYLQNVTIIIFSTSFPNQTHAEALAAHQAAENAVRAAAGQVLTMIRSESGWAWWLGVALGCRASAIYLQKNSSLWRLSMNNRHKRECSAVDFAAKPHP